MWLGCFITFLVTIPCLFSVYWFCGDLVVVGFFEDTTTSRGFVAMLFSLCALLIPVQMLTTIQSFVQSLYVLWADDPQALDDTHPREAQMLKTACYGHKQYQMRYDDQLIIVQGARYA